jgi:16S rRNA A1518/A1519 N6-dimethyltransferase RsmA/KsgA/DIM1 with predicted DNA glycosylase/AP lyase activity
VLAQNYKGRLAKPVIDTILAELQLPAGARAEELEVDQLVALSNRLQLALVSQTPESTTNEPTRDA